MNEHILIAEPLTVSQPDGGSVTNGIGFRRATDSELILRVRACLTELEARGYRPAEGITDEVIGELFSIAPADLRPALSLVGLCDVINAATAEIARRTEAA